MTWMPGYQVFGSFLRLCDLHSPPGFRSSRVLRIRKSGRKQLGRILMLARLISANAAECPSMGNERVITF